jgi:hypothetical protein
MKRDIVRAEREDQLAPLQEQLLKTQVEAGTLGLKRTQQELDAGDRVALAAKRMEDFNTWRSQNPQADFAAMNTKAKELGMSVDEQFKLASNITGINEQDFKASQQRIRDLVKNKGLDGLLKAHKESDDLDPGSHFEATRGKNGVLSLNRVDTATGQVIQANVFSGTEAETTAYLNKAAMDPATIIDFTMTLDKNKAAIDASRAQTRASDSTVSLNSAKTAQTNAQTKILNMNLEGNEKARELQTALANLDEADPMFATKQANLIAQFNALNVAPGKTIPMGGTGGKGGLLKQAVDTKKNDDGTYTAYRRDTGEAIYNTYNGEQMPLGMEIDEYKAMKKAARASGVELIRGEDNGRLVLKYAGADGKFYDDPDKAKYAKPAPAEKKPAADGEKVGLTTDRASGEKNPFVDAKGRPLANPPQGAPSAGSGLVKTIAETAEANVGTVAAATRYIQGKIDRKEPLSANERARALQLGLINR